MIAGLSPICVSTTLAIGTRELLGETIEENHRIGFFNVEQNGPKSVAFQYVTCNAFERRFCELRPGCLRVCGRYPELLRVGVNEKLPDEVIVEGHHRSGSENL